MKANIEINSENIITNVITYPMNNSLITVDINSLDDINIGIDRYINGQIVCDENKLKNKILIQEKFKEINRLKKYLVDTDYIAIKYAEGELTPEEYSVFKTDRHNARISINKLEEEIAVIKI